MTSPRLLYFDQNAWIALAQGSWDASAYPAEHAALTRVVQARKDNRILVPLSFTNIYETSKINDVVRRAHLARVQSLISDGKVLRSRRRILEESLVQHISKRSGLQPPAQEADWFLSDLWFESAGDYTPEQHGFEISERVLGLIRENPAFALFNYLAEPDDDVRMEAVRRYSVSSVDLISKLEARRALAASESFALRKRAYGAQLVIDELDNIFRIANRLGLPWKSVRDMSASLLKSFATEIPIMDVERELAVRLEDQQRATNENDLRDMASFTSALPFAEILVGEKAFVNLARQAKLGEKYDTLLLTRVTDLTDDMMSAREAGVTP